MNSEELEHRLRDAVLGRPVPEPGQTQMQAILSRREAGERVVLPIDARPVKWPAIRWIVVAAAAAAASIVAVNQMGSLGSREGSTTQTVASLLGPDQLFAQATDHPTFPVIHTTRPLPARSWRYAWRMVDSLNFDSTSTWLAERRAEAYQSRPAYRFDYSTWGALNDRVLSDTVWLDSDGFRPIVRQAMTSTGHRITQEFKETSVVTGFTSPTGWTEWHSEEYNTSFFHMAGDPKRRPAPRLAGLASQVGTWRLQILTGLEAATMSPNWHGSLEIISAPGGFWATRFWLNFQVRGEERVTVPAGTFDTWKVQVGEENPFLVWVSKSENRIVQVGAERGTMREVLLETALK
jgi:hypothetical protein